MRIPRSCSLLAFALLAVACPDKKKVSCSKASPPLASTRMESALYTLSGTGSGQCLAVQVGARLLITTQSCVKDLCQEHCEETLHLRSVETKNPSVITRMEAFPEYTSIHEVTVSGFDLLKIEVRDPLPTVALEVAAAETAQEILDNNRGRILDDDQRHLVLAKTQPALEWLAVNARFPMGVDDQEFLVGYAKRQACLPDRGGALMGRVDDQQPYRLLGLTTRGYPDRDWRQDCSYSDGNVISLLTQEAVTSWLNQGFPGGAEPEPTPVATPTPTCP